MAFLLAFCEGRNTGRSDHGDIDPLLKRSTNGGRTWSKAGLVHEEREDKTITVGNPCPVVDRQTGVFWLTMCRDNDRVLMTRSKNDGLSWETSRDIPASTKHPVWGRYATGPGNGIQRASGRLLIPSDHRPESSNSLDRGGASRCIHSDDGRGSAARGQVPKGKRGRGRCPTGRHGVGGGFGDVADRAARMTFDDVLSQECEELLDCLDDDVQRKIAVLKLQGYSNAEIAQTFGVVRRTIERKVALIRKNLRSRI